MKFNREKIASIEVVEMVQTIRGAHNIELVQAGGYCSLVPQHLFNEGDKVVVIQKGVMLPRWAEVIGESPSGVYLKRNKYVVKPIRLRGVWSDCLMLHISIVNAIEPDLISGGIPVGMDIRHILGVWDEKDPFPVIDVSDVELPIGPTKPQVNILYKDENDNSGLIQVPVGTVLDGVVVTEDTGLTVTEGDGFISELVIDETDAPVNHVITTTSSDSIIWLPSDINSSDRGDNSNFSWVQ